MPSRQISDNLLLVQEVLNGFRRAKGRKGYIVWKVDLSKAYDRNSWKYILDVVWEIGIRRRIYNLIKQCITLVEYRVLLNEEKLRNLNPSVDLDKEISYHLTYLFRVWKSYLSW